MLGMLIHTLEAILVGLVVLGGYRVNQLAKADPMLSANAASHTGEDNTQMDHTYADDLSEITVHDPYEVKMNSLKQAQAFAGNQLFEITREYQQTRDSMPEWLEEAISLYLIGAVDFISKHENCENKARKDIITAILKSNLKLKSEEAQAYFVEAVCREPNSDNDNMVLAGASAAKAWLQQQIIPESHKLTTQVQSWGVLA